MMHRFFYSPGRIEHAEVRLLCILAIVTFVAVSLCGADSTFVDSLSSAGKLGIPVQQAKDIESRLGQLFIVNVDGFGYGGPLALEPEFAPMIAQLQVGGVIPHYGSTSYERIRRTNHALKKLTRPPLLVCADIVKIKGAGVVGTFGDGYVGGFLGRFKRLPDSELEALARLNAFGFAAMGINVVLGPTVDTSTADPRTPDRARLVISALKEFGLEPVIKHFPYLPARANLHRQSPDTLVPPDEVQRRFAVFHELEDEAGIMMTTHLYDSLVDPRIVTFSSAWNRLLRSGTGFTGLLMSDGLLMLRNYADTKMLSIIPGDPDAPGIDRTSSWALRAILAGHDFIIVEGSAALTSRTFQGLLAIACSGTPLGRELRERIQESYGKIERWKQEHEASLSREIDVPADVITTVVQALPTDSADLNTFRFDARALAGLEPALVKAKPRP